MKRTTGKEHVVHNVQKGQTNKQRKCYMTSRSLEFVCLELRVKIGKETQRASKHLRMTAAFVPFRAVASYGIN